ncbi:hypothetical protein ElyMa_004284300 [Elysia marginata]|uniref:Uncharacterized protein n=1 Tax=Elysia marginata TaxID=1093978 RepID=A0AAV4GV95_9GAST|nr:hypothetical protein ElyMa_004284300 [Elysia marginata]
MRGDGVCDCNDDDDDNNTTTAMVVAVFTTRITVGMGMVIVMMMMMMMMMMMTMINLENPSVNFGHKIPHRLQYYLKLFFKNKDGLFMHFIDHKNMRTTGTNANCNKFMHRGT